MWKGLALGAFASASYLLGLLTARSLLWAKDNCSRPHVVWGEDRAGKPSPGLAVECHL